MPTYDGFWAAGTEGTAENMNATVVQFGTAAARMAAGKKGVLYFATDTKALSYDNGSAWVEIQIAPTVKNKTADETVNNSTTLQDDDDLVVAILANETWIVEMVLLVTTDAGADFKLQVNGPTASAGYVTAITTRYEAAAANDLVRGAAALGSPMSIVGTTTAYTIKVTAIVRNGANAGNITLQWAQDAAVVADTKVLTDSYLVATRK